VAQNTILPVKFNFCQKKFATKFVGLCENFQRQSRSYIIPLSNGPYYFIKIAGDVPIYLKFALKVTHAFRNADLDRFRLVVPQL